MKKEINVKSSWDSVTWAEYKLMVNDMAKENDAKRREMILLSRMTDLTEEEIRGLDAVSLASIYDCLSFLSEEVPAYMPDEEKEICGKKYVFTINPVAMSAAQFFDYKNILAENGAEDKEIRLIACMCHPEGCEYGEGYDYDALTDTLKKNLSVREVTSYSNFFMIAFRAYAGATLRYLEKKLKRMERKSRLMSKLGRKTAEPEKIAQCRNSLRQMREILSSGNGGYTA